MFKILKNLTKKNILYIFIVFIFTLLGVWLELKMPDYMTEITKLVQTSGSKLNDILSNGLYMVLCAFGSMITSVVAGYLISVLASDFSMNTRKKLFTKIEDMAMEDIKKFQISSLITRTTNDITQVERFLCMGIHVLFKAPLTALIAITKISNKSIEWTTATAVTVLILLSVMITIMIIVIPKFKLIQKLTDKLNNVTRENLTGIRVVRAFNAENYQEDKFEDVNKELTNTLLFSLKRFSIMSPFMFLVMNTLALTIYYIGAGLINNAPILDKVSLFGDMIVFSSYSMQIIISFLMLVIVFMMLPRADVSAKRINEVFNCTIKIKEGNRSKVENLGTVEFKNVSFKYPDADEYLLKDITFKANKGEIVAFIGSTGSGKSTLINLIPRFYDVTDGEVLIDNVNVKDYKFSLLNEKIGYISQKAVMFSGTVKSNILFGSTNKKRTEEDMKKAIKVSQSEEFVNKLEDKYESSIAQGGTNISGGQKQRLSIARAIAKDPEIYIFDDSFSALDYKTDFTLRKELKKHTKDATVLIVAQRIGTIMNADKIIVLEQGNCVGIGTHKELLKSCEVYKQIALSQFREEELENA